MLLICLHKNNISLHKNTSINSIDLPVFAAVTDTDLHYIFDFSGSQF